MHTDTGENGAPRQRNASFGQTLRAVLWSFFGVRRSAEYKKDAARLNPVHVIIVGIAAAALFVFVLIMIARAVVG
jgi:hypothetical protein